MYKRSGIIIIVLTLAVILCVGCIDESKNNNVVSNENITESETIKEIVEQTTKKETTEAAVTEEPTKKETTEAAVTEEPTKKETTEENVTEEPTEKETATEKKTTEKITEEITTEEPTTEENKEVQDLSDFCECAHIMFNTAVKNQTEIDLVIRDIEGNVIGNVVKGEMVEYKGVAIYYEEEIRYGDEVYREETPYYVYAFINYNGVEGYTGDYYINKNPINDLSGYQIGTKGWHEYWLDKKIEDFLEKTDVCSPQMYHKGTWYEIFKGYIIGDYDTITDLCTYTIYWPI